MCVMPYCLRISSDDAARRFEMYRPGMARISLMLGLNSSEKPRMLIADSRLVYYRSEVFVCDVYVRNITNA